MWLVSRGSVLLGVTATGVPVTWIEPPGPTPCRPCFLGAVAQPSVYQLAAGIQVEDAISAAGCALKDADLSSLNLAAIL